MSPWAASPATRFTVKSLPFGSASLPLPFAPFSVRVRAMGSVGHVAGGRTAGWLLRRRG
jgi:hypothetical protein